MNRIAPPLVAALLAGSLASHVASPPAAPVAAPAPVRAPAPAAAPTPGGADEIWVETSSAKVLLPASVGGRVSVTTCPTCPVVMLQVSAESVFRIDGRTVSLDEWRTFVGRNGPYETDVGYRVKDSVLLVATVQSVARLTDGGR